MVKRVFYKLLVAQVLSSAAVMIAMVVDSIMIGRFLGAEAIAAYGFANPVVLLVTAIANTLSVGTQVVCSNAVGKGQHQKVNQYFSVIMTLGMAISLSGLVIILTCSSPIAGLLGAVEEPIHGMTMGYMLGFYIGAPAVFGSLIMVPFVQLAGEQNRLVVAVSAMTVADILFDLLNVKVFHGGLFGMGLASGLSYYIAFFIGISGFVKKDAVFHFSWKDIKLSCIPPVLKNGITTVVNLVSSVILTFCMNWLLSTSAGNDRVAAYSILNTLVNLCYAVIIGISSVVLTLSGIYSKEEDNYALRDLIRVSTGFAIISHALLTGVIFITAPWIVKMFIATEDPVYLITVTAVRVFSLSLIPSALNSMFKNYYQGIERIRRAQIISFLQNFVCVYVAALLMNMLAGADGIWYGYPIGECVVLLIIIVTTMIYHRKTSMKAYRFALLPVDFGVAKADFFDAVILNENDAGMVAKDAGDFCKDHDQAGRLPMYISLFIEEMTVNIIHNGFTDDKEHRIDVRMFLKEGRWTIRIRDDCKAYNPIQYARNLEKMEEDPEYIGVKMVYAMAKNIEYNYTMSMNNLTIYV